MEKFPSFTEVRKFSTESIDNLLEVLTQQTNLIVGVGTGLNDFNSVSLVVQFLLKEMNLAEERCSIDVTTLCVNVGKGFYLTLEVIDFNLMLFESTVVIFKALKNLSDLFIMIINTVSILLGTVFLFGCLLFKSHNPTHYGINFGLLCVAFVQFRDFKLRAGGSVVTLKAACWGMIECI